MGRTAGGAKKRQAQAQESRLLNLIDQADTIRRYDDLLRKVAKGSLDVPAFLKEVSLDAALKVAHLMHTSPNEKVQLAAATDLLDRAGHGATTKHQHGGIIHVDHDTSKMELINLILSSARKAGIRTKESTEALLEARKETVNVTPPSPDIVDTVAKTLDAQLVDPAAPACLKGDPDEDE